MATPKYLECNLCGNQQPYEPFVPAICKKCESQWLEARYDYDAFKREILRGLPNRPSNMWRYQDILPLRIPRLWSFIPQAELHYGCRNASHARWDMTPFI